MELLVAINRFLPLQVSAVILTLSLSKGKDSEELYSP
jgi:hypothetical protein